METAEEPIEPLIEGLRRVAIGEGSAGEETQLCRPHAKAQGVVQVEIVDFVGTQHRFRQLANLLGVVPGNQLWGDRQGQHRFQRPGQGLVVLLRCIGSHQIGDERLRHAAVYVIARHVISVEGAPPQGQLGKVSRADHEPPELIGAIEENLRTFPGLGVLKGHVRRHPIVPKVGEVLSHRRTNVDALEGKAQHLGQGPHEPEGFFAGPGARKGEGAQRRRRQAKAP